MYDKDYEIEYDEKKLTIQLVVKNKILYLPA